MKLKIFFFLNLLFVTCMQANAQVKSQQECVFDARFSASNVDMPSEMYPDQKDDVSVSVENTGTCIWKGNEVELRVSIYRGPSGSKVQRDELVPSSPLYAPTTGYRESYRFMYKIEAPYYLGEYIIEYQMLFKGQEFGPSIKKTIKIVPKK